MVVVDEASMLSIEMLAGILCKMPATCSLVLIGDPNQLGSVGSGNVLPDLLALGFPVTRLTQQYRQAANDNALQYLSLIHISSFGPIAILHACFVISLPSVFNFGYKLFAVTFFTLNMFQIIFVHTLCS